MKLNHLRWNPLCTGPPWGPLVSKVMVLDEQALPLRRAWCLFELLQTKLIASERASSFQGLLLCTSSPLADLSARISVASLGFFVQRQ